MEKFQSFLLTHFGISLPGRDIEHIYIEKLRNNRCPDYLREFKKPDQWENFSKAFFNSIQSQKTLGPNHHKSKCGVRLCSVLNPDKFDFWEELYDNLGEKIFKFTFNYYKLFYKVNNAYVCLTCKPQNSQKSHSFLSSSAKSILERSDYLGHYGQRRISKEKLLYRTSSKKWPKNSIFSSANVSVEDLLNDICNIDSTQCSIDSHLKQSLRKQPGVIKGLAQLIAVHKRQPFIKTYEKFNFESVAGEINRNELLLFIKHIITNYVPKELLGGRTFLFRLANFLKLIMKRNVNQITTIRETIKYMYDGENGQRVILISRLIYWIIHEYIFKILIMFFYFNLSPKFEMMAFTGRYWSNRENKMIKSLMRRKKLGLCDDEDVSSDNTIRFLPKSDGVSFRLLVLNRNKVQKALTHNVLIFIRQLTAKMKLEAGFKEQNLHKLWSSFHETCPTDSKLYYMKTDIKDAFGSVKPDVLMRILDRELDKIESDVLELVKFNYRNTMFKKSVKQYNCLTLTLPSGIAYEDPEFIEEISKTHLRDVIWYHLNSVKFKLRNRPGLYRMMEGLPQGGQLSAVLCELYFTALDIEYLMEFVSCDFIIRLVDDYLFVSTSYKRAKRFVHIMYCGFPDYNAQMEKAKSITNVNTEDLYNVPFFGHIIDTRTHSIEIYAPYLLNRKILSTMSFTKINIDLLMTRMKNTTGLKLQAALLNTSYNTEDVLISNLMFSSYLMALKFKALVELISTQYNIPVEYMTQCAEAAIFLVSKNAVKSSKQLSFSCVKYIACRCFLHVLSGHCDYKYVVKILSLTASRISKKFIVGLWPPIGGFSVQQDYSVTIDKGVIIYMPSEALQRTILIQTYSDQKDHILVIHSFLLEVVQGLA